MKTLAYLAIAAAMVSLILSIISRFTLAIMPVAPGGVDARGLLTFTNTCFLIAIIAILLPTLKK